MKKIILILLIAFSGIQSFTQVADNNPRIFNVKLFGAKGDGVTDDTRAIQKAINSCFNNGGGTVWFPNGKYKLSDTLTTTTTLNSPNSLIYIPSIAMLSGNRVSIKLQGESNILTPSGYSSIAAFSTGSKGVILYGTTTGSGTNPSVIGTKGVSGNYRDYNYNPIEIENITVRTYTNSGTQAPTLTGINMMYAATVSIRNCAVSLDTTNQMSASPVSSEVAGIILGGDNNDGPNVIENTYVSGYKYGYIIGDHTILNNAFAFCNYYGYVFPQGDFTITGKIQPVANVNQVYIPNWNVMGIAKDSSAFLDLVAECEFDSTLYHGSFWYSSVLNVVDSGNYGRGVIRWVNHAAPFVGNSPISKYGSTVLKNHLLDRPLPVNGGGTGFGTYTTGDLLYASSSTALSKIPVGSSSQVLTVSGGVPAWVTPGSSSSWNILGNSGTTAGTNFIGTTDNVNVVFKRNNVQSGLIDSTSVVGGKTLFGYGAGVSATAPNGTTAFGFKALALNSGGTGGNTAFGNLALYSNTTQTDNTGVGSGALYSNNSAGSNGNTAVGSAALYTATNGSGQQTAVGAFALTSATYGTGNTAIGHSALRYITQYSSNIAIGASAGSQYAGPVNMTASGSSIYIGNATKAAANAQTNQIVIGDNATGFGSNTAAIGTSATLSTRLWGKLTHDATNTTAGTTGAQTINKPTGTVNFAAAATSIVVTNSFCTATSLVFAEVRTNDGTAYIKNVVPAAGSFTINLGAAATAETSVGFFIVN